MNNGHRGPDERKARPRAGVPANSVSQPFPERLAERTPGLYLGLALAAALGGYLVLLALPAGTLLLGLSVLGGLVGPAGLAQAWPWLLVQGAAAGLLGWASYGLLRERIPAPSGIEPDPGSDLAALVTELRTRLHTPKLHCILIIAAPEVSLVRTPQGVLQPRLTNTLQIGLPLLLSTSPETLRVLVAQRLGQLAHGLRHVPGWIRLLVEAWHQLAATLASDSGHGSRLAHRIAAGYGRLLEHLARPALRQAELLAERTALEILDDGQVKAALTQHALVRQILERVFWSDFWGLAKRYPSPPSGPLGLMARTVAEHSTPERALRRITGLMDERRRDARPTLRESLESLGYRVADLPPSLDRTAAEALLGDETQTLVADLDRQWLARHHDAWQARHRRGKERLRDGLLLLKKAKAGTLSEEESWTFAQLVQQRIRDKRRASKLFKRLLSADPRDPRTQFLAGRWLVESGDEAGTRALLRAAELDPGLRTQALRLIARCAASARRAQPTLTPGHGDVIRLPGTI